MAAIRQADAIEIRRIQGKGRGVFARRAIREGEAFETCPVLILPPEVIEAPSAVLSSYVFDWGDGHLALALGYGSLYNHSYEPNARYEDIGRRAKRFVAIREIAAGEEITINYNGAPEDRTPVWFDVIEGVPESAVRAPRTRPRAARVARR